MNIFYTDSCPIVAASNLCKVHLNKMYQESCQLLSTALQLTTNNLPEGLCKITHQNHPSSVWTRSSITHYNWLVAHTKALRSLIEKPEHGYDKYFDLILSVKPNLPSKVFVTPPKCINVDEFPELKHDIIFKQTEECYKKYLKVKYHNWITRTDKRRMKVEFIGTTPEYMRGVNL